LDPDSSGQHARRRPSRRRSLRGLTLLAIPVALPLALTVSTVLELSVFVLLLLLSGMFSGSEVALFSLRAPERELLRQDRTPAAKRVLRMLEKPRRLLVTILLLNNVINVAAAILATVLTLRAAAVIGLPPTVLIVVQVVVLTFLLLVLSEITPKLIATWRNVDFAKATSLPVYACFVVCRPLTSGLAKLMGTLQDRVRARAPLMSTDDLKTLADLGEREGTLQQDEAALIHSIVEFGDTTVREVMISRVDVYALPETATIDEAFALIRSSGHSRFPVFREHLDNVLGILYAKDLIPYLRRNGSGELEIDWAKAVRPARFVPLGRKLTDMLADFQLSGTHIAIVVDEYGGTAGIITLEDILEEIVGEIRDEHDRPESALYELIRDDVFRVDAGIDLDDLNTAFGLDIDTDVFDFETLGGLILHLLGDIPDEGSVVEYDRLHLTVEKIESNRIQSVLVEIQPQSIPADGSGHDDEERGN
jgi:putative hemolysin